MNPSNADTLVLLVDDEPYIIEMLAKELTKKGVPHISASDGKSAFRFIEERKPTVVVSDYKMPGLTGIELLQFLRSLGQPAPVIWITGNADEKTTREARELGIFHLFDKPFDPEKVAREVQKAISFAEVERNHAKSVNFTESYREKYFQKINLELERELYEQLKEKCLASGTPFGQYISDLIRKSLRG